MNLIAMSAQDRCLSVAAGVGKQSCRVRVPARPLNDFVPRSLQWGRRQLRVDFLARIEYAHPTNAFM